MKLVSSDKLASEVSNKMGAYEVGYFDGLYGQTESFTPPDRFLREDDKKQYAQGYQDGFEDTAFFQDF